MLKIRTFSCRIMFFFHFLSFLYFKFSYDTTDRTIFDESGIGYTDSHIDNRIECTELVNSGKTYVHMKSEPGGGSSSPESSAEIGGGPDDCAGCGRLIQVNRAKNQILFSINFTKSNTNPFYSSITDFRLYCHVILSRILLK